MQDLREHSSTADPRFFSWRAPTIERLVGLQYWLRRRGPRAESIVDTSALPLGVKEVILGVLGRVGCRRAERVELAQELAAHFADALEHGSSTHDAIAAFGDSRAAARLMRRAIRRKRGFSWIAWWYLSRGGAALVALGIVAYTGLALQFFMTKPNIAVNYLAKIAELVDRGRPDERAWPLYRDALGSMRELPRGILSLPEGQVGFSILSEFGRPGTPDWEAVAAALVSHSDAIGALREAASRRVLGLIPGEVDAEDQLRLGWPANDGSSDPRSWSNSLISIPLLHVNELRLANGWLLADARVATSESDGSRAVADLIAAMAISRQVRGPLLVEQMVSFFLLVRTSWVTGELLAWRPDAIAAGDLQALAEALDGVPDGLLRFCSEGEHLVWADSLQRLYSDDGAGSGNLVWYGFEERLVTGSPSGNRWISEKLHDAAAPAFAMTAPSRREVARRFDLWSECLRQLQERGAWTWSHADLEPEPVATWLAEGPWLFSGFSLTGLMAPPTLSFIRSVPTARLHLDTARLATALVRFERREGRWPSALSELVPEFIRAVPLDPYDGAPLRYELRDGLPTLWSIGPDRVDDRLQSALRIDPARPHYWQPPTADGGPIGAIGDGSDRGDVLLWRPLRESIDESP